LPEMSILNVDDYVPGRYARTKILRQLGFPIFEAGTGAEAIEMTVLHRPTLVLLDVNLPDMSGFDVCRRIRSNPDTASTTIVHMSASSIQSQHQVIGLDAGADGYIVEPVDPEVLVATLNAFLRARRAEEALRKSTEELRWFSYRVAHDLNEPLRTITVYAQMLKRGEAGATDGDRERCLDFIEGAAVRMRTFMDGLLDYSQATAGRTESSAIDCNLLLERVIANMDAAIRESGAQIVHEALPVVIADARLEYVFQNLLSNAIKYCRDGTRPEISILAKRDGDFWVFSVRDNGIGIARQHLDGVFEVFKRLHGHEIAGNGIGLALCRKVVEAQGGTIWVESESDLGSTFYFSLPFRSGAA
jgi:two-component system, sensor histidine kinase and response regulator